MKSQLHRTIPRDGQMFEVDLSVKTRQESEVCNLGTVLTGAHDRFTGCKSRLAKRSCGFF